MDLMQFSPICAFQQDSQVTGSLKILLQKHYQISISLNMSIFYILIGCSFIKKYLLEIHVFVNYKLCIGTKAKKI